ncbi:MULTISPECIES: type II secretion system major pseudopilin GspG [unclassified Schlesneria]|uniref:type II secretion system major pseudopilin GspG n=1 Tax=Schlesneria TaxID=656899 RepID=UPI002EEB5DC7
MVKSKRSQQPGRAGFTLVEMLVVLAILVLLISMVGPRILGSKQKADVNGAKTQIGMLMSALEHYVVDMREYPDTEIGLAALIEDPSKDEETKSSWDGPYLKKSQIPKDPWGRDYQYQFPPTHGKRKEPEIWSLGPDGQEDTEDDIVSWDAEAKDGA